MEKSIKLMFQMAIVVAFLLATACGGGGEKKKEDVQLSKKGELLCSKSWKIDSNATIKGTTDKVEDTTGIIADIELGGDVKKMVDFFVETLRFQIDASDPTKLAYSRTSGQGLFSTKIVGYWEFNEDESAIIMKEWDDEAGKEKPPVKYDIVELTEERLVLQKESAASPYIYFPVE